MQRGFADAGGAPLRPERPDPPAAADFAGPHGLTAATPTFASTGPHGHRARMRSRLLKSGAATLADYEILEMLLFLGIPYRDTKPLAKATLNRFGSLHAVLQAEPESLRAAPEITPGCLAAIRLVQQAAVCLAAAETRINPVLSNWLALQSYLADRPPAGLRVLYLDSRNRLLADEVQPGPALDAPARRAILRRALELHAVSLLLAANRDDPCPTRVDCAALLDLRHAGTAVSVGVHDLALITPEGLVSTQQAV